ncbi:uncharacterized protein FOMMEDRAFT_123809 [Fomitiporia mediterranea MF3/22]|uniref:uncharacterized protein n=1 Tax=Fomitiporia mediterranea (strain MF3/22) TaxID=694068 RepID=UPI0004409C49|nr:uncharacterized protein FOMMEDRAFT_123809 [Fomitiporia mediterranea MF3/22]EJD01785.1 hypothetical protein FOMMEDRAFT_123809 [Fomitiporia mediterranea MF3/22]
MRNNEQRLDSISETVISIPFGGSDDEDDFEEDEEEITTAGFFPCIMYTNPDPTNSDLPDGQRLRMKAFTDAFGRCEERVQEVFRRIYAPTTAHIFEVVRDAYCPCGEDRIMPYTELRVIAVSGTDSSATSTILEDVQSLLVKFGTGDGIGDGEEEEAARTPVLVSRLTPADCQNMTTTMKTIISGFVVSDRENEDDGENENVQGPYRTLAPYDIYRLECWYDRLRASRGNAALPKLVVLVKGLENIEPQIMQDLFYICSLHAPRLPLVFVLGLTTAPTPSYLHATFPRRTLALLNVTQVEVASGMNLLERLLIDVFFDPSFQSTIMLSPTILTFIVDQFRQNVQSIEFVMSLLKLIYLRHFGEPLSVLALDELLGASSIEDAAEKLSMSAARDFFLRLFARLQQSDKLRFGTGEGPMTNGAGSQKTSEHSPRKSSSKWKERAVQGAVLDASSSLMSPLHILRRIYKLRRRHQHRLRRIQMVFRFASEIRKWLLKTGEIRKEDGRGAKMGRAVGTEVDMMSACLRGTLAGREGEVLASGIRRLDGNTLCALLTSLDIIIRNLPTEVRTVEEDSIGLFARWISRLNGLSTDEDAAVDITADIACEVSKWFVDYLSENMHDFTETELWHIWYTGNPTGIMEMYDPAPRSAIINALVHPQRYLNHEADPRTNEASFPALMQENRKRRAGNGIDGADAEDLNPDTVLLFKGYLESGRMTNVYDWYMSFKEYLEARRRTTEVRWRGKKDRHKAVRKIGDASRDPGSAPSSPTKARVRGRGRPRGRGGSGRGRGRGRGRGTRGGRERTVADNEGGTSYSETSDDSENELRLAEHERWEAEVQARFIRSVQELDLLGFIKHTGRKADHVQKTMHESAEYS